MIKSILMGVAGAAFLAVCWYEWHARGSVRPGYDWSRTSSGDPNNGVPDFALTPAGQEARRKAWVACIVLGLALAALLPMLDLV